MFLIVLASFCLQFTYAGAEIKPGEPPLVIVSLDGMDWRVLKNHRFTPNLDFIARTGVTADYIKNVVPSSTWPNHHSPPDRCLFRKPRHRGEQVLGSRLRRNVHLPLRLLKL